MKNKVVNRLLRISLLLWIVTLLMGCSTKERLQETRALFSWKKTAVTEEKEQLFRIMKDRKLNTLYQEFSSELQEEEIKVFLKEAKEEGIDVYLLTGAPEWALESNGESMLHRFEKAIEINQTAGETHGLKGIIYDIEPYLLKEWNNENSFKIMDSFVEGMKEVYQTSRDSSLEIILCIPYYYDDTGYLEQLTALIESGCDQVAIMNYYQGKEFDNIKNEVSLASEYGKKVINIYELKAPGEHGLKENNTYFEEGITVVGENFASLKAAFKEKLELSLAFHDYEALKEVDGYE